MAVGVPAGWYQDYQDAALLRWWDGTQWTAHTQPRPDRGPFRRAARPAMRAVYRVRALRSLSLAAMNGVRPASVT